MRRAAPLFLAIACALPAAAQAQAPPLRVRLVACRSGAASADRTATFVGSMPAVKGTKRMWMRFDLLARVPPQTGFEKIRAPKLGVWQKSVPGRVSSGFVFTQRVQGLTAPGSFRAQVRFRWYGSSGRLLRCSTLDEEWDRNREHHQSQLHRDLRLCRSQHDLRIAWTAVERTRTGRRCQRECYLLSAPGESDGPRMPLVCRR